MPDQLDLGDLRRMWDQRRRAARRVLRRFDTRGMRRPARGADERAWIKQRDEAWFIEDEAMAEAARRYYERRYSGS